MEILLMGRYPHLGRFQKEGAEDLARARRMLSYVGLGAIEERGFSALSGGERQLVLFAKALVQDTDALLLDEPSSNLDIHHQDRIFSMAQELAREGRAVVASVHNLSVAAQYCSRLVLLEKGRIASDGRPEQVLRSEILDGVYGIRTMVSPSLATGSLTVTVVPRDRGAAGIRVHLIGGAGSAVNLTRELYRMGCSLTGGIAHEYDSDEKLWRSLGVRCSAVGAFSRITEEQIREAARFRGTGGHDDSLFVPGRSREPRESPACLACAPAGGAEPGARRNAAHVPVSGGKGPLRAGVRRRSAA